MTGLHALIPVPTLIGVVVLAGVASAASDPPTSSRLPACVTSGPVRGLTGAQAENARIIVATAEARLGPAAAEISVMTALTESGLRILSNPADPVSSAYPNQGVGADHDSVGLFQQRPSWGTAAARMDPVASTNLFLDALETDRAWRTEKPWEAAQAVQRSAFDGVANRSNGGSSIYGGNYLAQHAAAVAIVGEIDAGAADLECGGSSGPGPTAPARGSFGLPAGFVIEPSASLGARVAVAYALAQLGKPYLWGGTGPDRFDCSGLTLMAWRAGGRQLGRTTWQQANDGVRGTLQTLRPGDLVLVPGSDGSMAAPGHVGLYIGRGLVVHAPKSGDVIRITDVAGFVADGLAAIRHIA
jgi:cell wall-associated NlpC family hydrolase